MNPRDNEWLDAAESARALVSGEYVLPEEMRNKLERRKEKQRLWGERRRNIKRKLKALIREGDRAEEELDVVRADLRDDIEMFGRALQKIDLSEIAK